MNIREVLKLYLEKLKVIARVVEEEDGTRVYICLPDIVWRLEDGKILVIGTYRTLGTNLELNIHISEKLELYDFTWIIAKNIALNFKTLTKDKVRCFYIFTNIPEKVATVVKTVHGYVCREVEPYLVKCCRES